MKFKTNGSKEAAALRFFIKFNLFAIPLYVLAAINFDFLLAHIDRLGYPGWMGCEYIPKGDTVAGLAWAKRYL